ncbi:CaiB/BaiF CoA transferase family protein [Thermodesulfobacteriota bacterium B35]
MSEQPFAGIRVLDFAHEWAASIGPRLLGDLGAEVIRVEYARRMCVIRGARLGRKMYNRHPRWHQVNRNKRSLTLDLRQERDLDAFMDLVRISDIMVSNSRPHVLEKLGIAYDDLKRVRPDIILVLMSAFGTGGPWSGFAGFGGTIEPLSGLQQLTAYSRQGKRYRTREMDVCNGLMGTCAIMTALLHRQRTGEGQFVDLSQTETATHSLMGEHLLEYVMNREQTLPLGNRHSYFAPQGCYPCRGDDRWVTLTVQSEKQWQALCGLMGRPQWVDDERFAGRSRRRRYHDLIDEAIAAWSRELSHYQAMHLLQGAGIPSGAVLDGRDLQQDEHLAARDYFMTAGDAGDLLFPGLLFRSSGGDGRIFRRGPDLGEGNEYVLRDLLGRPEDEVSRLDEKEIGTGYDPE